MPDRKKKGEQVDEEKARFGGQGGRGQLVLTKKQRTKKINEHKKKLIRTGHLLFLTSRSLLFITYHPVMIFLSNFFIMPVL